ncbi:MAG TPA: MFS transporter [Amycolatopsis sp.]|nr:MFS transporter [Amycolatopsis sp.]
MLQHRKRYLVYGGMFVLMLVSYVDRINLSIAAKPIANAYGLSTIAVGYLLSAYLWTYLVFLIPLGFAVDRWGARRVTAASMVLWSAGGALTGVAGGFASMLGSRMVLGAGEAAGYPAGGRVIREWAPRSERGLAAAWLNGGAYAGPAIGAVVVGWVVTQFGWQQSFLVTGAVGLVIAALWYVLYRGPERAGWISGTERELILRERDDAPVQGSGREKARASLRVLLRSKTMWGLLLTQGCAGYTLYLFMSWLPTYLASSRGLDVLKSSAFTAVPYAAAAVLGLALGKASDAFLRRSHLASGGRRKIIAVCTLLSAVILAAPFVTATWLLLALFSVSLTCVSTAMAMNIALTNDLLTDGSRSGVAVSVLIFGGNTFGLLAPIVTGYAVAATSSFSTAFGIAGLLLLIGTTLILTMTRRPIDTATTVAAPTAGAAIPTRK